RSSRFSTHVNDFSPLRDQFHPVRHCGATVQELSGIRKRIGRDVDDAHHQGRSRKRELKLSGTKNHDPPQRWIIWLTPSTSRRAIADTSSSGTPICGLEL